MRIVAGEWRGRTLVAPAGQSTRPTADRTRETLFSMLASRLGGFEGLQVADLFAGSGALGLEALSRGAAHVTFYENDRAAFEAIETNVRKLGAEERASLRRQSALALGSGAPFDLIVADPPYSEGSGTAVVESIAGYDRLAPGGWLAVETERGDSVDPGPFDLDDERDIGRARLTLLRF
jgi:16S rRNA (guanine966-N2)-methyltransferase